MGVRLKAGLPLTPTRCAGRGHPKDGGGDGDAVGQPPPIQTPGKAGTCDGSRQAQG